MKNKSHLSIKWVIILVSFFSMIIIVNGANYTQYTNVPLELPDSIKLNVEVFPGEIKCKGNLLRTRTFHKDEVWNSAVSEKWMGLFKGKKGYYLSSTDLKTERIHDVLLDHPNAKTGWRVFVENKDYNIMLASGLDLKPGKVVPAFFQEKELLPSDSLKFNYSGVDYILFATGGVKEVRDGVMVWNYKLFLSAKRNGHIITELLSAQPDFDDNIINVLFAGDLDKDGFLDLLIDNSRHYNVINPTLYLSGEAENGHLLKVVAMHRSTGC